MRVFLVSLASWWLIPAAVAHAAPLTLEHAVELAVARDERARIAGEDVAVADAEVDRARAFFFPDVTATGAYTYRGNPGQFQERSTFSATGAIGLTLFDGRGIPLYRAAKRQRDAARLDRTEASRQIALEAAAAFLVTLGAQAVVEAAQHRVDFAQENVEDARGRVTAQLASSNDVTRAELERETAALELRRAAGELERTRLHLGWLLGARLDGPLAEPDALLGAAGAGAAGTTDAAVAARLDLRAARVRVEAARELAEEPLWRWVPSLSLLGQASTTSAEGFTGKTTDWFVSLSAQWALWDGGERSADRAARIAEARRAELVADRQTRQVDLEVSTADAALGTARDTVAAATAAVTAARKNVEETRILYKEGLARALEVADASARLFDAEVAVARERYGLGQALLQRRAAAGQGPLGGAP